MIRALTPDDLEAYRALRLHSLVEAPASSWASYDEESTMALDAMRQRLLQTPYQSVFGAFKDNTLIGVAALKREPGKKISHRANIWGIYIDPAARRTGAARALVAAIIDYARTIPELVQLTLVVGSNNEVATRLYASLGFIVTGVERRSTRIGEQYHDETRMVLFLDA